MGLVEANRRGDDMMGEASIFISYELWDDLNLHVGNLSRVLQFPEGWIIRDLIDDPSTGSFEVVISGKGLTGTMVSVAVKGKKIGDDLITWDWKAAEPWEEYEYPRDKRSSREIAKDINALFAIESEGL